MYVNSRGDDMASLEYGSRKNMESTAVIDSKKDSFDSIKELDVRFKKMMQDLEDQGVFEVDRDKEILPIKDIDQKWIVENEASEGKIDYSSTADKDTNISGIEIDKDALLKRIYEMDENETFVDFAKRMISKYQTNDYHRMMTKEETNKFKKLYAEMYNYDIGHVGILLEDTIAKQLTRERSHDELMQQGQYQEEFMKLDTDLYAKYGVNFLAYLDDKALDDFSMLYLKAFNERRSTIDKEIENSIDRAYAEKTNKTEENDRSFSKGFLSLKLLLIMISSFMICMFIFLSYFIE